jgi:hypothetical protein
LHARTALQRRWQRMVLYPFPSPVTMLLSVTEALGPPRCSICCELVPYATAESPRFDERVGP